MDAGKQGILYHSTPITWAIWVTGRLSSIFRQPVHNCPAWSIGTVQGMAPLYLWGQTDRLRAYPFDGERLKERLSPIRPDVTQGHPGAMLSLSANGKRNWHSLGQ